MRSPPRSTWLALAMLVGCGGSAEVEGVELTHGFGEGMADCLVRDDDGDDITSRCTYVTLVDARDVDVLFVIDDGPEAGALQARLADAMDDFATAIAALDPRPRLRIAFTSSRGPAPMCAGEGGAGRLLLSSCAERPDAFVDVSGADRFAELCTDRCPLAELPTLATPLDSGGPARPRPWLEIEGDTTNLAVDAPIADALRCASLLGVAGCPFPAPASATEYSFLRADQDGDQPEVGVFRTEATPIIVWVTSGVECSLGAAGPDAFDPAGSRALWTDPDAATPGLCWNAGVACTAPEASGEMSCTPRDVDADGMDVSPEQAVLQPTDEITDFLRDLADWRAFYIPGRDLRLVAITGIPAETGDPTIAFAPADEATAAYYGVQPSCMLDGDALVPPVRHAVLGGDSNTNDAIATELVSACTDDFRPALARVADAIASSLRPMCLPICAADIDPDAPGLQADCSLQADMPAADGNGVERFALPRCDTSSGLATIPPGERACFTTRSDDALHRECSDAGYNLEFEVQWAGRKPAGTYFLPHCDPSTDKASDCPEL